MDVELLKKQYLEEGKTLQQLSILHKKTPTGIKLILMRNNVNIIKRDYRNFIKHKRIIDKYHEILAANKNKKPLPHYKIAQMIGVTTITLRNHLRKAYENSKHKNIS